HHYVVVVGLDAEGVRVHDPALGPDLAIGRDELLRRWDQGGRWMMRVGARVAAPVVPRADAPPAAEPPPSDALRAASERFRAGDFATAARHARAAAAAGDAR